MACATGDWSRHRFHSCVVIHTFTNTLNLTASTQFVVIILYKGGEAHDGAQARFPDDLFTLLIFLVFFVSFSIYDKLSESAGHGLSGQYVYRRYKKKWVRLIVKSGYLQTFADNIRHNALSKYFSGIILNSGRSRFAYFAKTKH